MHKETAVLELRDARMSRLVLILIILSGFVLTGCGGGAASKDDPVVITPPPPTPPPPPSTSPFNTLEFQANWGLYGVKALAAYDAGLSGAGLVIATVDTGVDLQQNDLDDNIHAASKDIYDGTAHFIQTIGGSTSTFSGTRTGGPSLDDVEGHGTLIAGIIAAEKNDVETHGLAFNAKVLVIRADDGDTCPFDCEFDDDAIAAAVNYAVAQGVDIITLSLGGSPANPYLEGAMADAVAAGVIFVIAAGNAPQESAPYSPSANADPFALEALQSWANGQILIAGASNSLDVISDFSNRAGTGASFYLLAPGESIYSTTVNRNTGETTHGIGDGTSFSAPLVAAAAALLIENFPSLSAAEVVEILLSTAFDIGIVGVDGINGHGILDLEAALAPLGTTSLSIKTASGTIQLDMDDIVLLPGGVFGDGFGLGFSGGAIFLDSYDRAYTSRLEELIHAASPYTDFLARLESARDFKMARVALGSGASLALGTRYEEGRSLYEQEVLGLRDGDDARTSDVRFKITTQIGIKTAVTMGVGGALDEVFEPYAEVRGNYGRGLFLTKGARTPWSLQAGSGRRFGVHHQFGDSLSMAVAWGSDQVDVPGGANGGAVNLGRDATRTTVMSQLAWSRPSGGWDVSVGLVEERGMVLESFGAGALQLGRGAQTTFVTLGAHKELGTYAGKPVSGFGRLVGGQTLVDEISGGAFAGFESLMTSQFAFGLAARGVLSPSGRLSFVIAQPMRLEAGGVRLATAWGYDYAGERALYSDKVHGLSPSGRELDFELGYRLGLGGGAHVSANLMYQARPGHVEGQDGAVSLMITGRSAF